MTCFRVFSFLLLCAYPLLNTAAFAESKELSESEVAHLETQVQKSEQVIGNFSETSTLEELSAFEDGPLTQATHAVFGTPEKPVSPSARVIALRKRLEVVFKKSSDLRLQIEAQGKKEAAFTYPGHTIEITESIACGYNEVQFESLQEKGGKPSAYKVSQVLPATWVDCAKIPEKEKNPPGVIGVRTQLSEAGLEMDGAVTVFQFGPSLSETPSGKRRLLHVFVYNSKLKKSSAPCGEDEPSVVCEQDKERGAPVKEWNKLTHYLQKAKEAKQEKSAYFCKRARAGVLDSEASLKSMFPGSQVLSSFSWTSQTTLKTKDFGLLTQDSFSKHWSDAKSEIEAVSTESYCSF